MMKQRKPLMNIGVAGIVAGSLTMAACKQEIVEAAGGNAAALQEQLQAAEADQQELKEELEQLQTKARAKRKEIEAAKKVQDESLADVQRQLREAKKKTAALDAAFDAYREEYKVSIRKSAKGIELGNVALTSGPTFADVVVSKWTPTALRVTHSGGSKVLPFEDLPQTVQTMFVYDKEETEALIAKGNEAVTTGKPAVKTPDVASKERWPTKDPNGNTLPLEFTGPDNSGFVNVEKLTPLDKAIKKYDKQIAQGEAQINKLDKAIHDAVMRGSAGGQSSYEKKAERLMSQLEKVRADRAKLIVKRNRAER